MTEIEKIDAYTCSVQDFLKKFRSQKFDNPSLALAHAMQYIAKYNIENTLTTCELNELIYTAKNEIAKIIAKTQIELNEKDYTNLHTTDNKEFLNQFFSDPTGAIAYYFENNKEYFNIPENIPDDEKIFKIQVKENISFLANKLKNEQAKIKYQKFEHEKSNVFNVLSIVESKLPNGKKPIEESLNKQKPGFFEKIFRTTSNDYKIFKAAFDCYNDKKHPLYGVDENLKDAAHAYLVHKFPNLGKNQLPTLNDINKLSGAAKERARFCLEVYNAIKEKENLQEHVDDMIKDIKNLNVKAPWDNNYQAEFQKELNEQVEENVIEDNNLENVNLIDRDIYRENNM